MGQITLGEQAAPAAPSSGITIYTTVATPSIPMILDDAGNDRAIATVTATTWTPVIAGSSTAGSHTYTVQTGRYLKLGPLVIVTFNVVINSKDGAMAGDVRITGLPFTVRNVTNAHWGSTLWTWSSLATSIIQAPIYAAINTTHANVLKVTAATASVGAMVAADLQNGSQLAGTIAYDTAS